MGPPLTHVLDVCDRTHVDVVTVRVEPAGVDVEVAEGQSVMAAAEEQGLFWPTACHGQAECQTCVFEVVRGGDGLEPPNALEEAALRQFAGRSWYGDSVIRLACQTRVSGPVTVRKPGVRARGVPTSPRSPDEPEESP